MPVIVQHLTQPSAQDRLDLLKIYADAPDWLLAPLPRRRRAGRTAGLAAGQLITGRFNDRLLGAALVRARRRYLAAVAPLRARQSPADAAWPAACSTRRGAWLCCKGPRCG